MDANGTKTYLEDPKLLVAKFVSLKREHNGRQMLDKICRRLYYDLPIAIPYDANLPYREFGQFETLGQLGFNLTREVIDASAATVCEKLDASVEPVGADYETERDCLNLGAVVEGVFEAAEFWDLLGPIAYVDGSASCLGTILWYLDGTTGEILGTNVDPLRVYWDYNQGRNPIDLFIDWYPARAGLISQFPKHKEAIKKLNKCVPPSVVGVNFPGSRGADTVRVLMTWRRALGEHSGRFIALAPGEGDGVVLANDDWKSSGFPTAHYRYDWDSEGFGGYAGARVLAPYHFASNRLLRNVMDGFEGMVPTVLANEMEQDVEFSTVGWRRKFWKHQKPEVYMPNSVSDKQLAQLERLEQKAHFAFGMNKDAAAGTRPAGLDSEPAQRKWVEIRNQRLSKQFANWAKLAKDSARAIVALASEAYKNKTVRTRAPGTALLEEIKWPVNLQEKKFMITFKESSDVDSTLAGIKQNLAELRDRGAIDEAEYLRVLQSPDIRAEMKRINAAADLASRQISRALNDCVFEMPDSLQGKGIEIGVTMGTQEYQRARASKKYPPKNLECLRRFIQACDARRKGLTAVAPAIPVPGVLPGQPASVAPAPTSILPPAAPLPAPPAAPVPAPGGAA